MTGDSLSPQHDWVGTIFSDFESPWCMVNVQYACLTDYCCFRLLLSANHWPLAIMHCKLQKQHSLWPPLSLQPCFPISAFNTGNCLLLPPVKMCTQYLIQTESLTNQSSYHIRGFKIYFNCYVQLRVMPYSVQFVQKQVLPYPIWDWMESLPRSDYIWYISHVSC